MLYNRVKRMINESVDSEFVDVFENALEHFDQDEDVDEYDYEDAIRDECDSWFIYYQDAWDYLQDNNITDFDEAIDEWGAKDVCAIACYYFVEACMRELSEYWDEYAYSDEDPEEYNPEDDE